MVRAKPCPNVSLKKAVHSSKSENETVVICFCCSKHQLEALFKRDPQECLSENLLVNLDRKLNCFKELVEMHYKTKVHNSD